ncbi:MAG: hypothetical protein ACHQNV_07020 [Vicinamibacteria bacterium]
MTRELAADIVIWLGGFVVVGLIIVLKRRARRHGGAMRAGVVGAMYEWQNQDRQRALDLIVEGKAEARRPEYPDGHLPDLDSPKGKRNGET